MTLPTHRRLHRAALLLLALAAAHTTHGATPAAAPAAIVTPTIDEVIAKARAALGPEDKLTGVVTLRLTGNVVETSAQAATTTPVILMFKKPSNQRVEIHHADGSIEVSATDGMAGWAVLTNKDGSQKLRLIGPPNLDDFVYGGLENMYFYRAAEHVIGSNTTLEGPMPFHDAKCWKLSVAYPHSLTITRYIDTTTGELRGTETSSDHSTSFESGRITEGGIKFPAEVKSYDKDDKLMQTLNITKVEINQPMEDKIFDTPLLASLHGPPPVSGNITLDARSGSTVATQPLAPDNVAPLPPLAPLNSAAPASTAPASGNQTLDLPPLKK